MQLSQVKCSHWRPLTKVFLSLFLALVVYYLSQPNFESPWILCSALAFSVLNYGEKLTTRLVAITACLALALIAVGLSIVFAYQPLIWALYLFAVTFLCVYLGNKYPQFFVASLVINIFAIVSGGMETDLEYSISRCFFILCGSMIALLSEILFWPRFVAQRKEETARTLQKLKKLNALHFSCMVQSDYPENTERYEGRIYHLKSKLFSKNPLIPLSELVIDLGRIRYQVGDHATFHVCVRELEDILLAMNGLFEDLSQKKFKDHLENYDTAVEALEDIYQGMLVQVAKEPLLFQLFLYKLKLFRTEYERLCE